MPKAGEYIPAPTPKKMPDGGKKTSSLPGMVMPPEPIGAPAPRALELGHSPY